MATHAMTAVGLTISGSSGGTTNTDYTDFLAEITDISMNLSVDDIDVSHFNSDEADYGNGYKEYIQASLKEPGELSGTMNFNPADEPPLGEDSSTITINFPDGATTWSFSGYLKEFTMNGTVDSQMTADFTIKATGAITF